jgi:mutator protein MutT
MAKPIPIAAGLFRLPDGRIVLNRRSQDSPVSGGLLAFYGGHIDEGERPEQAVKREISEETSLDVDGLKIEFLARYKIKEATDKEFFLYEVHVPKADFEVYEGDGSETFSRNEILSRQDIALSVRYALENIINK